MGLAELYLIKKYKPDTIIDVSKRNWTYDLEMYHNNNITTVEVKDRTVTLDWILDKDDIMIELMQEYAFYDNFGTAPFEYATLKAKKFNSSLGWIYTEAMDKLIYIKKVDTETRKGIVIYDIDFIAFKAYFITHLIHKNYCIVKNTKQKSSNSQSFNMVIPITDFPESCWTKYELVKEKVDD
jgi:hypothetical protein